MNNKEMTAYLEFQRNCLNCLAKVLLCFKFNVCVFQKGEKEVITRHPQCSNRGRRSSKWFFRKQMVITSAKAKSTNLGFSENFLLSGCAAAVSKTSAAPIERVKLLLQNQGELLKQAQ